MNKRTVFLCSMLSALALFATAAVGASASEGPSPAPPVEQTAGQDRPDGKPGKRARMLLRRLVKQHERVERRMERLTAAIEKHCSGAVPPTPTASPDGATRGRSAEQVAKRCERAKKQLARLQRLEEKLEQLIDRIKSRLADEPSEATG